MDQFLYVIECLAIGIPAAALTALVICGPIYLLMLVLPRPK